MKRTTTDRLVLDALWIRRWACTLLGGGEPPPDLTERVADCDATAWWIALSAERFALPLSAHPLARTLLPRMQEGARAAFESVRMTELQRAMSVHAQIRQLAAAASREGWRVVVLKGGVAIAEGLYLDVQDLDVLAHPEEIGAVTRFIESGGAVATGRSPAVTGHRHAHLTPRRAPGSAQVDVHFRVHGLGPAEELIARAEPLSAEPGLLRLSPEDQGFHLVRHLLYHHPDRAAMLRDVILVGHALRDCSAAVMDGIRERVAGLPHPASARKLLDFAEALRSGRFQGDPYEKLAAGSYLSRALYGGKGLSLSRNRTTSELLHGRDHYLSWAGDLLTRMDPATGRMWMEDLARRSPGLVIALRRAYWSARLLADLPRGWPVARRATRLAERFRALAGG
jgi:hypothetical protein